MIIVDNALQAREAAGNPIRVGMIGAGFMGRGLLNQIVHSVPGERMVAVYNRHLEKAVEAYRYAGLDPVVVQDERDLDDAIANDRPAVTDDWTLLTRSSQIDALVDVTGAVEFGAHMVTDAFSNGKHVVLMNAELDATIGPILQVYARKAGVILSACDGDQPGVEINLFRYVQGLGLIPRVMGNIKGLQDPYRNPTTQQGFAERWGQNPTMVTSFADGSKVSFEQTIVANACGLKVPRRGMLGRDHHGHVDELTTMYDLDMLRELGGIVDYVVGARPTRASTAWPSTPIPSTATTSTCTSWARDRCTASTRRGTCATSRCRTRSPASSCSATRPGSRWAGRWSRCAPSPSATWPRARCSTTTACT